MTRKTATPKQRDPLKTAAGKPYTYVGWVRAYHAAEKAGNYSLARRFEDAYSEHFRRYRHAHQITEHQAHERNAHPVKTPRKAKSKPPKHRYVVKLRRLDALNRTHDTLAIVYNTTKDGAAKTAIQQHARNWNIPASRIHVVSVDTD